MRGWKRRDDFIILWFVENEGDKENGEKSETSSPSRSLKAPTVTREPSFKSGKKEENVLLYKRELGYP